MNICRTSFVFVILAVLAGPAFAFHTSGSTPIDFDGWDQSVVTASGQTFATACGDITVRATGAIAAPAAFGTTMTGGETALRIGAGEDGLDAGTSQSYAMTFELDFPLVIDIDRLDREEKLTITTSGSVDYNHSEGMSPTEMMSSSGGVNTLMLTGTAFGGGATGASIGYLSLGATPSLTLTYTALSEYTNDAGTAVTVTGQKFGGFAFGKGVSVPEPNSAGLLVFGLFGMLGMGRKSSRRVRS